MAEGKNSFVLYTDYINIFEKLTDEEAGKLAKHLFAYVNDRNPKSDDRLVELIFEPIKQQLKRDLKEWENKKESKSTNGRLGNLKRWNNDLYEQVVDEKISLEKAEEIAQDRKTSHSDSSRQNSSQSVANIAVTDTVTVNDTVEEIPPLPPKGDDKRDKIDYKKLVEFYHNKCPDLPGIRVLSNARKRSVNARVKEHGKSAVMEMFEKAGKSPFLNGDNDRGWVADFDWLFKPTNFVKVIEGHYPDKKREVQQTYKPGDK